MWTINEATSFLAEIHSDLLAIGCDVGIYGSVARGEYGNDLDLVVWAPDGGPVSLLEVADVFERHGAIQSEAYGGGPEHYLVLWRCSQQLHVRALTAGGVSMRSPATSPFRGLHPLFTNE